MTIIKPVVFPFEEPIVIGEGDAQQTFKELTFSRQMKGKDLLAMDAVSGELRKSFALYASMAGVPIFVFEEMGVDDFSDMALAVAPLMGKRGKKVMEAELAKLEADKTVN